MARTTTQTETLRLTVQLHEAREDLDAERAAARELRQKLQEALAENARLKALLELETVTPADLVEQLATGILVRGGERITSDVAYERARNIAIGLSGVAVR